MGGIGSGNHGGKPTVEESLVLDLNRLIRQGTFKPGCAWGGSVVWTEVSSGRQVASIGYEAHMGQESGWGCATPPPTTGLARRLITTTGWS